MLSSPANAASSRSFYCVTEYAEVTKFLTSRVRPYVSDYRYPSSAARMQMHALTTQPRTGTSSSQIRQTRHAHASSSIIILVLLASNVLDL